VNRQPTPTSATKPPEGLERIKIGDVLAGSANGSDQSNDMSNQKPAGELLRILTPEDEQQYNQSQQTEPFEIFEECQKLLSDHQVSIDVIDCERLFDGETIIRYFLGEETTAMQPIAEELGKRWQVEVLFNLGIEPVAAPRGGDCGSSGRRSGGVGAAQEKSETED
jgi:hypothetical protein